LTATYEVITSQMPSHAKITNSVSLVICMHLISGNAVTA